MTRSSNSNFYSHLFIMEIPSTCVVKFTAKWCGPCKNPELKQTLQKLSEKYDLKVVEVDIDEHEDIATAYECKSIPLMVFQHENKVVDTCLGFNAANLTKCFSNLKKNQISLPILKDAEVKNDQ